MPPLTGAKQAGGAPLPDRPATPLLTLSRRLLFSSSTSPACNSQGRSGGALSRREASLCLTAALPPFSSYHPNPSSPHIPPHAPPRAGLVAHSAGGRFGGALSRWEARLCLTAVIPPFSSYHPNPASPHLPPHAPPRAGLVWSGGALSWWEARLSLTAVLPPFSSYHPNPASPHLPPHAPPRAGLVAHSAGGRRASASLPCSPPSLPVTPTPLPPNFPRMRLPGQVWWSTQQGRGAPLPDCRAPPLLFLSPQPRFPSSSPASASQGRSGGALSRWEARLCLTAPLDPPSLPVTPIPLSLPIPRMRPPGQVWWRTQQVGGAPLPDCRAPPLLFLSPQPRFPPSSPACASQGRSGGALSRSEARLWLTAVLPPFSSCHPNPSPPDYPPHAAPRCGLVAHSAGQVWWRTQQVGGAPLPDCRAPPLLFLSPQPRFPPSSPACASQGRSGGALSRWEARLCLTALLPPFSSCHPNPSPPDYPPHAAPRCGLVAHSAGQVWWRTQLVGGTPLPDCRAPPLLFLSPQPRFPPSSPASASQSRSGGALSRWEARLCLTAMLPPFSSYHPNPASPHLPPHAPPRAGLVAHSAGVVLCRTQQVGGAPLPVCRAPPLLFLSPQPLPPHTSPAATAQIPRVAQRTQSPATPMLSQSPHPLSPSCTASTPLTTCRWWRTLQSNKGHASSILRACRRSPSPCTLPPLSPAHPPLPGDSYMTLVAHSAGGYLDCLF
ncbi:unnamed protein product [Closterium sp. NIES-65]|nr:unnamed protein product [Closterium sp. NIES-65]